MFFIFDTTAVSKHFTNSSLQLHLQYLKIELFLLALGFLV